MRKTGNQTNHKYPQISWNPENRDPHISEHPVPETRIQFHTLLCEKNTSHNCREVMHIIWLILTAHATQRDADRDAEMAALLTYTVELCTARGIIVATDIQC